MKAFAIAICLMAYMSALVGYSYGIKHAPTKMYVNCPFITEHNIAVSREWLMEHLANPKLQILLSEVEATPNQKVLIRDMYCDMAQETK